MPERATVLRTLGLRYYKGVSETVLSKVIPSSATDLRGCLASARLRHGGLSLAHLLYRTIECPRACRQASGPAQDPKKAAVLRTYVR